MEATFWWQISWEADSPVLFAYFNITDTNVKHSERKRKMWNIYTVDYVIHIPPTFGSSSPPRPRVLSLSLSSVVKWCSTSNWFTGEMLVFNISLCWETLTPNGHFTLWHQFVGLRGNMRYHRALQEIISLLTRMMMLCLKIYTWRWNKPDVSNFLSLTTLRKTFFFYLYVILLIENLIFHVQWLGYR